MATELEKLIDQIIVPEMADAQAKALIELIFSISDERSPDQFAKAEKAGHEIYKRTYEFDQAFKRFADLDIERQDNDSDITSYHEIA